MGWRDCPAARWVKECKVVYWGDLDSHGFAILNQLRSHHQHVLSVLMDRDTLDAYREFWGREDKPSTGRLEHLSDEESSLYDALTSTTEYRNVRLEQEQINWELAMREISLACGWPLKGYTPSDRSV
ncbi:Wadjet anti-phage system protein JetD domain-containing protein [Glutamicibacter halophytocola]|uniref:Wadjet anti-phage system protein JetD domain-containing protein n=1 Tax=Glutamicibacter halophytocola TaxID=1933880 RepID=UPI003D288C74